MFDNVINIREIIERTPAEKFNDHKRSCRHTDLMKTGMGLCIAQISPSCGYNLRLAVTQFNGFPCCLSCKEWLIQKQKRTHHLTLIKKYTDEEWGKEIARGNILK